MSSKDRGGKPVDDPETTDRPYPLLWNQFPSLKIVRQAKGRHSPQVDERCFSYCSQSVRGRVEQREPWCRTFCLRRVFAHEVQRVLAAHDGQKPGGKQKGLPLPPEGQHVLVGETPESQGHAPHDDVRCWEEGYYVWLSKSRWAAQERLDLMMTSLERQAQWDKYKQDRTEAWEQQQSRAEGQAAKALEDVSKGPAGLPSPTRRPFPDISGQSILLPVPPSFPPLWGQIDKLLAPTRKVLALTQVTIESGDQLRLAHRLLEKALTPEPFVLARNVCVRFWDKWRKDPPDDAT